MVKIGFAWAVGYFVTWFAKWVIVDVLADRTVIKTALEQLKYRTTGGTQNVSFIMGILGIYKKYMSGYLMLELMIAIIYIFINKKQFTNKIELVKILPYIVVSIMPIVWYFVTKQHSFQHQFFTYRNMALIMIGIPLILMNLVKVNKGEKTSFE
ncbi:MAG: hypothetical protein HFJ57_00180 [Clostridia bacterium]|nr:hypothetical protein [Clostridia bacterium]